MNFRSLVKKIIPIQLFKKIEPYGHWFETVLAQIFYGFPAKHLKVIAVTGTDGKTTTCSYIAQMLRSSGHKVAMMNTIAIDYGDGKLVANPTRLTTVGAFVLVKELSKFKKARVEYLVLEVTSHALAQNRIWGVPISVAVITNLGHEHLDYHGTFERYRLAKQKLFILCNQNSKGLRTGVINADDPNAEYFKSPIAHSLTYGLKNGDIKAFDIELKPDSTTYQATYGDKTYTINTHLPGTFNIYNSLSALCVGVVLGLDQSQIEAGINDLQEVEGRMHKVDEGQAFDVIVDYAHTPESFEKLFSELKPVVKNHLIAVFGNAGRRDEEKRAVQGEIAGKYCDLIFITEEDDRDIDGEEIMKQIAGGAQKQGKKIGEDLFLVHKREDAIEAALTIAKPGDMVLLLGKGHEKSILTNGPKAAEFRHLPQDDGDPRRVIKRDYDEVVAAQNALKKISGKGPSAPKYW